jgi:sortase B
MVIYEIVSERENVKNFEELASLVSKPEPSGSTTNSPGSSSESESSSNPFAGIGNGGNRDLSPLYEINEDFLGWLYIPDTNINYPVMHTPASPNKYLRKNFFGERSTAGVPYMKESCNLESDNIVIYGHNMRNGTMFTDLLKFLKQDNFYSHSYFEFQTENGVEYYDIFAVVQLEGTDIWYRFNEAADESSFNYMINYIRGKATIKTDLIPKYGDKLITLSTCTTPSSATERVIIIGCKISFE